MEYFQLLQVGSPALAGADGRFLDGDTPLPAGTFLWSLRKLLIPW